MDERNQNLITDSLPAYAYAGQEELTEISIPAGTRRIGRYAFYNCKNLQKLTFRSDIEDLGAGAFTGCHKVHTLEVTQVTENHACLKEFLSELPEQMLVILHGNIEARLHFPEFFEESVENTPARILVIETYGSGKWFRNCFVRRVLNFEEYDRCFTVAKAQESKEFLVRLAFDRLWYPHGLIEKAEADYRAYLDAHQKELWEYLLAEKDVNMLKAYLALFSPSEAVLSELTTLVTEQEYPEATPYLMEYRRTHFKKKKRSFSLDF